MSLDARAILTGIPGYDPVATAPAGHYFDEAAAGLALDFFPEMLTFVEGEKAEQPFVLEPWQQAFVGNLFGWKRPSGLRRYVEALLYVARKNGKTPLLAGIVDYVLFCDGEPGAQLYSAAAEREQAALIYRHASGMILRNPLLDECCKIYRTFKSIEHPATNSLYKALSADANTKHGLNVHLAAVDELHAHPNGDLVDVLKTGTVNRREPLLIYITTADYARPSVCNRTYQHAIRVRDGEVDDPGFLPCIYEASPKDDWTQIETWRQANPNLGVSVQEKWLARECLRAQEEPSYENTFKRLHLNIITEQAERWISLEKWQACAGELDALALADSLAGQPCTGGLDVSATSDVTALVLWFPGAQALVPFFWIPSSSAARREEHDRVPYRTWQRQGFMRMTEGNAVDQDRIRRDINGDIGKRFRLGSIGIDPWNATQLCMQLLGDGFDMVEFRQGFGSLNEPSKEFEKRIVSQRLIHGNHPVLNWMAANVSVTHDAAGNIKPDKSKSTEKIDGIVAAIMAIGRSMAGPAESVYEERGMISL